MTPAFASMVALLRHRAASQATDSAYALLSDRGAETHRLSFAELLQRAGGVAAALAARGGRGERALLLCPHGIEFLVGLFGCFLAGTIAVPMMLPRRSGRDAGAGIVADCAPRFALTTRAVLAGPRTDIAQRLAAAGIAPIVVDETAPAVMVPDDHAGSEDIALLQYTSGSTGAPKGVVVSHGNLLANLEMMRIAFGNTAASTHVGWVPLYHDMGLIANALQSIYIGALCVLLPPVAFIQRPLVWLRAIHDYRAEVAGGPNFAFDLCVGRYDAVQLAALDLSCWKLAFNAAEPVRADTIARFAATFGRHGFTAAMMRPTYGMAEATVLISSGRRGAESIVRRVSAAGLQRHRADPPADEDDAQPLVGCGRALPDEQIAVVEPETCRRCRVLEVGEVWARGPNIARGYWGNPGASAETFGGRIADEDGGGWLRTGDLGFLDDSGELFITGRIKDIVIIRGVNHYPQDIEDTVQECDSALSRHGGAAFATIDARGEERLVIVHEVERAGRHRIAPAELVGRIREAVVLQHEVAPYDIVLLRPGALPKTTSGKIQRGLARTLWQEGSLDRLEATPTRRSDQP